jgi:hypothetical protein
MDRSAIDPDLARDLTPRELLMSFELAIDELRDRLEDQVAGLHHEIRLARFCDER